MKERIPRKQRKLVRLAKVEGDKETPPRSLVSATASATPQEAWSSGAGQQGERSSYQQDCPGWQIWREQQGAKRRHLGQALELGDVKANKKVYSLAETLAQKEKEIKKMEERYKEYMELAKSVVKALQLEAGVVENQMHDKNQALINARRSAHDYREEGERERNRLAQELLEARAGNRVLVRDFQNALRQKEVAWADLLEELGSKNQELKLKDQELTKICSQLAMRGEETTTAAAAMAAPPGDSWAEVRAAEREQDGTAMGKWATGAEAKTQGQATLQPEQDQGVGQLGVRLGEPEVRATLLGRAEELTAPSQNQRGPSIQDSAAMDSQEVTQRG